MVWGILFHSERLHLLEVKGNLDSRTPLVSRSSEMIMTEISYSNKTVLVLMHRKFRSCSSRKKV